MTDSTTLHKEGFQHFLAGRYEEAIRCYRSAVEADPALIMAWNGLAMALDRSGDVDGAIKAGQRVVELDPEEPLGHTSLSIFYQKRGQIPEAEEEKALATQLTMKRHGS